MHFTAPIIVREYAFLCGKHQVSASQSSAHFRPNFNNQHKNTFPKRCYYVNTKLEVRKIPRDLNNIAKLNEHFSKFGTIVNIQVKCFGCCVAPVPCTEVAVWAVRENQASVDLNNPLFYLPKRNA